MAAVAAAAALTVAVTGRKEKNDTTAPLRGQSMSGVQWRMEQDGSESELFWEVFNYDGDNDDDDDDGDDDDGDSR